MKTKPISIRFDENDLALAQSLSGIKKPQKLVDLLISEYVRSLKGSPIPLPKDYMAIKDIVAIDKNGKVTQITNLNEQPKTNYSINTIPEVSRDAIKAAIDRLQKELNDCPKSYSEMGKIMWAKERNKKIELLKNQLK